MLNNKTAEEMNGGVQCKYFERTWTDTELEKYQYPSIDANTTLTDDEKEKEKARIKAGSTSKGLFPDYSVMQIYNPHTTQAVNVNNFYFDGTVVTTGALNLGKHTSLSKLQIQNDGAIANDHNGNLCVYDATTTSWDVLSKTALGFVLDICKSAASVIPTLASNGNYGDTANYTLSWNDNSTILIQSDALKNSKILPTVNLLRRQDAEETTYYRSMPLIGKIDTINGKLSVSIVNSTTGALVDFKTAASVNLLIQVNCIKL